MAAAYEKIWRQAGLNPCYHRERKNRSFTSPASKWHIWKPSPRLNKHVKALLTFDPKNYPIGLKDKSMGAGQKAPPKQRLGGAPQELGQLSI
jgi:hypothetical protein